MNLSPLCPHPYALLVILCSFSYVNRLKNGSNHRPGLQELAPSQGPIHFHLVMASLNSPPARLAFPTPAGLASFTGRHFCLANIIYWCVRSIWTPSLLFSASVSLPIKCAEPSHHCLKEVLKRWYKSCSASPLLSPSDVAEGCPLGLDSSTSQVGSQEEEGTKTRRQFGSASLLMLSRHSTRICCIR